MLKCWQRLNIELDMKTSLANRYADGYSNEFFPSNIQDFVLSVFVKN